MKKVLTTALVLGALYGTANATEIKPYVGLDAGYNIMNTKDIKWADEDTSKKANFGLNAGAKINFENKMFLGAELYYRLGKIADLSKSVQEDYPLYDARYIGKRTLEIENTFGAKLYLGYEFNDKMNAFVSFGLNRMELEYNGSDEVYEISSGDYLDADFYKYTNNKFAPSFGLGASYSFTKNIEARLSYEFINYKVDEELTDSVKSNTHSIRLGVNYLF